MAKIEADRRHLELTPELDITCHELGPDTRRAMLRIELIGPIDVPRLETIKVRIRDDGYTHLPDGQVIAQEMLDEQIWGPYRFNLGDGREKHSRPLAVDGDTWEQFVIHRTAPPLWDVDGDDLWEELYGRAPVLLLLECRAEGHKRWRMAKRVTVTPVS